MAAVRVRRCTPHSGCVDALYRPKKRTRSKLAVAHNLPNALADWKFALRGPALLLPTSIEWLTPELACPALFARFCSHESADF